MLKDAEIQRLLHGYNTNWAEEFQHMKLTYLSKAVNAEKTYVHYANMGILDWVPVLGPHTWRRIVMARLKLPSRWSGAAQAHYRSIEHKNDKDKKGATVRSTTTTHGRASPSGLHIARALLCPT